MQFRRLSLKNCAQASGTVIVIDVVRAFTTAAYAFAAGAREIVLTGTVEEALALRERFPGAWVMGEVGGSKPRGFDLGNSPSALDGLDLAGRRLIQRTSAGTQGVVCSSAAAETLLACSLCCAGATVRTLQALSPARVTFVITGIHAGSEGNDGDEDVACADYVEALLRGHAPDRARIVRRVRESYVGRVFLDPARRRVPASDLQHCTAIDRFDFAMQVRRQDGLLVMRPVR